MRGPEGGFDRTRIARLESLQDDVAPGHPPGTQAIIFHAVPPAFGNPRHLVIAKATRSLSLNPDIAVACHDFSDPTAVLLPIAVTVPVDRIHHDSVQAR